MKTERIAGALLALALTVTAGSAAQGLSYTGTKYGSEITTSGGTVYLKDNQNDGQFPSVNYSFDKARQKSGFSNKSGYNTTVAKTESSAITGIQPCVSRTLLPSSCGGWLGTPPK